MAYFCLRCGTGEQYNEVQMKDHNCDFHSNRKDFECKTCLNRETCLRLLRIHEEERHGIVASPERVYTCSVCMKSEMSSSGIDHHFDDIHPKLRFKCSACLNRFSTAAKRTTHGC